MFRRDFLLTGGAATLGVVGAATGMDRVRGAPDDAAAAYGLPPVAEWTANIIADPPSDWNVSGETVPGSQRMTVAGSTIYTVHNRESAGFGEYDAFLAAVDAETGSVEWLAGYDEQLSQPAVLEETLVISGTETVFAVSRDDGSERWRRETAGRHPTRASVGEDLFLVSSITYEGDYRHRTDDDGGAVEAFDRETGRKEWEAHGSGFYAPVVDRDNGQFYVMNGAWSGFPEFELTIEPRTLQCRNLESGALRWERTPAGNFDFPSIVDDTVLLPEFEGSVSAYDPADGRDRFSIAETTLEGTATAAFTRADNWYVSSVGGLTAIDLERESIVWSADLGPVWRAGILDGLLVAVVDGDELVFLDPATGDRLGEHALATTIDGWAIGTDRFYVADRTEITSYVGRRAAVGSRIEEVDEQGTFGRLSATLAAYFGKPGKVDDARASLEAGEYDRAEEALESAERRQNGADLLVGGTGLGVVAGATGYAGKRAYDSRRRTRAAESFDRLESRCDELAVRLDGGTTGLETLPENVRPSADAPFDEIEATLERFENTLDAYENLLDRAERVETRHERLDTPVRADPIVDVIAAARDEVRTGSTAEIVTRREQLQTAAETLERAEERDDLLQDLGPYAGAPGVAALRSQLESLAVAETDDDADVTAELSRCERTTELVERLARVDEWGRVETDDCWEQLADAVRNRREPPRRLSETVRACETLQEQVRAVDSFRDRNRPEYTGIDDGTLRAAVRRALEQRDSSILAEHVNRISRMEEAIWTTADLHSFHWADFEVLIGDLWAEMGYRTVVEKQTGDMGIDVVAENGRERIAIQVKNYAADNTVSNGVVRETGGLLPRGFDRAIVVTSSSFTQPARDEARTYGDRLELVDGTRLVNLLNQSPLVPPR
ncbi:restriction endonuclease [Natronolimnohabitans innermongolicus]|uniref:Restriction endonuclease n=1 Tax=Natronolimnohabitans innermongolicus JCM 12255 TaxID=1227499 RepID=L9WSV9_9EURY|nr:restriction endonuclease [Natronolimnohabitans innermongolicus]ELY52507.1 restriction endonuclease [Natronolimnohabitans innermongolicus JCM 12255]